MYVTRGHQRFFVYLHSTPAIHVYIRYKRTAVVLCLFTLYSSNTCVCTLEEDISGSLFIYSLPQQYMCMIHVTRGQQWFFVYLLSTPAIHMYDTRYKRTSAVLCLFTIYPSNTCVWYTLQEDSSGSLFIYSLPQQNICMIHVTRGHQRFFVYLLSTPAIHVYDTRYKRTSAVLCLFTIYPSNTCVWYTLQEDISGSLFIYSLPQQYMCMIHVTRGHQRFFVYLLSTPAIHMYDTRYKRTSAVLCLFTIYPSNTCVWYTLQEDISGSLFIYYLPQQYMCMIHVTRGHQRFFVYLLSTPAIHMYDTRYKRTSAVLCLFTIYPSNTCVWYTLQEDSSGSLFIYSLPQQNICMIHVTRGHQRFFVYLLSTPAIHVYDTRYKRTSAVLCLFTIYPSNTCVWYTLQEDISGSLFIYSLPQQYMCMIHVTRGHQRFFVYLLSTPAIHVYDTRYKRTSAVLCLFTLYPSNTCVWYTLQEDSSGSLFIYSLPQQYICMIHVTRGHQRFFVYLLSTPAIHVYDTRYKRTSAILCLFTIYPSNTCVLYTLQEDISGSLFIYSLPQQYMCMYVRRGHQPFFVYLLSTPAIHVYDTRYKRTSAVLCLFTIYSSNTCVWYTLQENISGSLFIYSLLQQYKCIIHVTRGHQRFFVYLLSTPAIHVYDTRYKRTSTSLCLFTLYPSNTCVWYTLQEDISGSLFIYSLLQQYMCMYVTRSQQWFFVYLLSTPAIHVYVRYKKSAVVLCLFTIYSSNTCVWYTLQEDSSGSLFIYSLPQQYMCMYVTRGHQPFFVYLLSTPAIHVYDTRYKRTSAVLCLFTIYSSNTCVWYTLQEDISGSLFIYYLLQQYMCMIHVTRRQQWFFVYLLSTPAIHVYDTRYKRTAVVLCLFTLYSSNTCVWYTLQEDISGSLFIYYLLQQYMCMIHVTRGQQWFFVYLLSTPAIHVYDTRYKRTSAVLCLFTIYSSNTCVWYTLQEDISGSLFICYLLQQYMCMIHVTRGHQRFFVYLLSTPAIHVYDTRYKRTAAVLCLFTLYPSNTCVWYTLQEDINLTLFIYSLPQQYMCMIHVTRGHQRFFVCLLSTPAIHVYDTLYKRTSAVLCLFSLYPSNTCVWYTLQEDINLTLFIYSLPQQYMCMYVTRSQQWFFVYLLSTPAIHVYVRYKRTAAVLCLFTLYSSNTCVWYTLQEDISGSLFIYYLLQQYMCMIHVTRGHQRFFVYLLSTPAIHVYVRYKRTSAVLCLFTIYSSNTCVW